MVRASGFGLVKRHFLTVGMAFVALYIRDPKSCLPEKNIGVQCGYQKV